MTHVVLPAQANIKQTLDLNLFYQESSGFTYAASAIGLTYLRVVSCVLILEKMVRCHSLVENEGKCDCEAVDSESLRTDRER